MISTSSMPWWACLARPSTSAETSSRSLLRRSFTVTLRELVAGVHPVHVRLQRDHEAVGVEVELLVEDLDGRLHAHDAAGDAVHHHVASDRVDAAEELGSERGADDGDRAAPPPVVFGEAAAAADRPVHEHRVLRREAGDEDALGASGRPARASTSSPAAGRRERPRTGRRCAPGLRSEARGSWRTASAPPSSPAPWA